MDRGARIVRQPGGVPELGTLLGWALGVGTPLGILVLGVSSSLS